jgi:heme-degrading monooxygenase HmoA
MYALHLTITVKPGREREYEQWKIAQSELITRAPGFVKRMVLRDVDEPRVYFYVTFWESQETLQAFDQSAELAELLRQYQPKLTYANPHERHQVEVVVDERASAIG